MDVQSEQLGKEITELKAKTQQLEAEFVKLKKRRLEDFFDRFLGRILGSALLVIVFLYAALPLGQRLGVDLEAIVPLGKCADIERDVVVTRGSADSRAVERANTQRSDKQGKVGQEADSQDKRKDSVDTSSVCRVRMWSYGIQVAGQIAWLWLVLWALLALASSDRRD